MQTAFKLLTTPPAVTEHPLGKLWIFPLPTPQALVGKSKKMSLCHWVTVGSRIYLNNMHFRRLLFIILSLLFKGKALTEIGSDLQILLLCMTNTSVSFTSTNATIIYVSSHFFFLLVFYFNFNLGIYLF